MSMLLSVRTCAGSCLESIPKTICVLPVPAGPAIMTGRRMLTSSCIQKLIEHVSGVGTVT